MTVQPHFRRYRPLAIALFCLAFVGAGDWVTSPALAQEEATAATTPVGRALERVNVGDLAGAAAILEPLASQAETSPLAKALLGGILLQLDRPADALEILQPLADDAAADPAVLFNAGRAALATGNLGQGDRYLTRSVERDPGSIASRELGLLRRRQGRIVDAYLLLKPWVESHPRDREAMLAAGHCAVEMQRAPDAEQILSFLAADDAEAVLIRGKLEVLKGSPESAIALVEPLIATAKAPLRRKMHLLVADAYLRSGNSAAAVALLQGKTAKDPLLRVFLARAHYQQGEVDGGKALCLPL